MVTCRLILLSHLLCWLITTSVWSESPDLTLALRRTAMVKRIDELISRRASEEGCEPAPIASDAEFLRRVHLDLTGVIPRVAEVRRFLADDDSNKRSDKIDFLLGSSRHATHLANTWRNIMLPSNLSPEQLQSVAGVQNWLREQFIDNMRYDRMVGDLLVVTGGGDSGPALFYTAMDLDPEKLAASTARIFLGLQMDCAKCHDHPFDHWTQSDFWGYAAFFAQLKQPDAMPPGQGGRVIDLNAGEVMLPTTEDVVLPKFPNGSSLSALENGSRREQLAIWMASRDNPFLSRAVVNRVWAHLFGIGLVNPVDDLRRDNPPSHPELFNELTSYFVEVGFDLRELLRTLCHTKTYQRSSQVRDSVPPPTLFAVMAIKPFTAEQLYDSLNRSLLQPAKLVANSLAVDAAFGDQERIAFLAKMRSSSRDRTQYDLGVPQALTLMNGAKVRDATDVKTSKLLTALDASLFQDSERLNVLFLATLSRMPSAEEALVFNQHIADSITGEGKQAALADALWALLNSAEYVLNH